MSEFLKGSFVLLFALLGYSATGDFSLAFFPLVPIIATGTIAFLVGSQVDDTVEVGVAKAFGKEAPPSQPIPDPALAGRIIPEQPSNLTGNSFLGGINQTLENTSDLIKVGLLAGGALFLFSKRKVIGKVLS